MKNAYNDFNMIVNDILVSSSPEIQIRRNWPQICLAAFPVLSSQELSRVFQTLERWMK